MECWGREGKNLFVNLSVKEREICRCEYYKAEKKNKTFRQEENK